MRYALAVLLVLCAVPAFAATATLTWTDTIANEAGYYVYRATKACDPVPPDADFAKVGETAANVKTYVDTTPPAQGKHWADTNADHSGQLRASDRRACFHRLLSPFGLPQFEDAGYQSGVVSHPREWLYLVPAFDIPTESNTINLDNTSDFPALMLFVERARAVRPDFKLTADNIQTIAEICARLDGLPLVIELIAARMRLMSPESLLERMSIQFVLSADGMRAPSERQKTLKNAIDWSYDLLSRNKSCSFTSQYLQVTLPWATMKRFLHTRLQKSPYRNCSPCFWIRVLYGV